eukprot:TRINITY_DN1944_c0_g2_i2.p2 TRINITY_DN1944_c0_g2~~TRINITY_DN1944_c0_g2_i2.p2  ORF type:complete len:123 (-),score=3.47 TRINITY_DN1944_c0_g2_i2:345-713(-)
MPQKGTPLVVAITPLQLRRKSLTSPKITAFAPPAAKDRLSVPHNECASLLTIFALAGTTAMQSLACTQVRILSSFYPAPCADSAVEGLTAERAEDPHTCISVLARRDVGAGPNNHCSCPFIL